MLQKYEKFLELTDHIANSSKDRSTKVGAILLNKDESAPRMFGYNGMPRGLDDNNEYRNERPEKYFWYEHAERNAIYNLARELLTNKIMFSTHFPDMESARAITSSGIKEVVVDLTGYNDIDINNKNQKEDRERVNALFAETNVLVTIIGNPINKKEKKYYDFVKTVKCYADLFCLNQKEKRGSMILDSKTFAPVENAFGVSGPIVNLNENYLNDKDLFDNNFFDKQQTAEKNAIFGSVREKLQNTTIVSSFCPCEDCALAIASVGINKVVTKAPDFTNESDLRWKCNFDKSVKFLKKSGIELILINKKSLHNNLYNNNNIKNPKHS